MMQIRNKAQKLISKKKRSDSSKKWLTRHINDPYVILAQKHNYRSRAAFKLIEINDKFRFLKAGVKILDLGAAPGGWSQVAIELIKNNKKDLVERQSKQNQHQIVALDLLDIPPIEGVDFIQGDFYDSNIIAEVKIRLNGYADIVMSDMAPNTCGHQRTDHLKITTLCESAYEFATKVLKENGVFVAKMFAGGASGDLLVSLKKSFKKVDHFKPKASRKESNEIYLIATGFRGAKND